jgi:hypothetical protein
VSFAAMTFCVAFQRVFVVVVVVVVYFVIDSVRKLLDKRWYSGVVHFAVMFEHIGVNRNIMILCPHIEFDYLGKGTVK